MPDMVADVVVVIVTLPEAPELESVFVRVIVPKLLLMAETLNAFALITSARESIVALAEPSISTSVAATVVLLKVNTKFYI